MKDLGLKKWNKFVFHFFRKKFKILASEKADFSGRQAGRKISMSELQRAPSNWGKGKLEIFSAIDFRFQRGRVSVRFSGRSVSTSLKIGHP